MINGFQRQTIQRRVILEELRQIRYHPTASELHRIIQRRLPRISLGTVYRNLDLLARMGIIQKLESAGAETRFDTNPHHHHHLYCLRCMRVEDIPAGRGDLGRTDIEELAGYRILGYRLQLLGICPACRAEQANTTQGEENRT